jgi:hypothetical protein
LSAAAVTHDLSSQTKTCADAFQCRLTGDDDDELGRLQATVHGRQEVAAGASSQPHQRVDPGRGGLDGYRLSRQLEDSCDYVFTAAGIAQNLFR